MTTEKRLTPYEQMQLTIKKIKEENEKFDKILDRTIDPERFEEEEENE